MELPPILEGFEWDDGNRHKNWLKHSVTTNECEQIFFNQPLLLQSDETHSTNESRIAALGQTRDGRRLAIVFTVRHNFVRIISARAQNKKERKFYEKVKSQTTPKI